MKTSLTPHTTGSDLFDEVALEGDVLRGLVQNGHGDDVAESLNLVDDGVGVRKVLAVIHVNRPVSDHLVQLVVDALWKKIKIKEAHRAFTRRVRFASFIFFLSQKLVNKMYLSFYIQLFIVKIRTKKAVKISHIYSLQIGDFIKELGEME